MKILLVDDDKAHNKMFSIKLEKKGHEVFSVTCGDECLEYITNNKVDLVLLDTNMPDTGGLKILKNLRQKFTAIELPIIMVTGNSGAEDIVVCLKNEANDYIIKPINMDVVIARINTQEKLKLLDSESSHKAELEAAHAMIVTYNHEINNPLTIALGLLYQIKDEEHKATIEKINSSLYRVVDIVKKIEQITIQTDLKYSKYSKTDSMIKLKG